MKKCDTIYDSLMVVDVADPSFNEELVATVLRQAMERNSFKEENMINSALDQLKKQCNDMIKQIDAIQNRTVSTTMRFDPYQQKEQDSKVESRKQIRHYIDKETNRGVCVAFESDEDSSSTSFWFSVALNENYSKEVGRTLVWERYATESPHFEFDSNGYVHIEEMLYLISGVNPKKDTLTFAHVIARLLGENR